MTYKLRKYISKYFNENRFSCESQIFCDKCLLYSILIKQKILERNKKAVPLTLINPIILLDNHINRAELFF